MGVVELCIACFASSISASLVMTKVYNIVLDDFVPHFSLQLTYPATHTTVSLGNEIPPSHVRKTPVFDFYPFTPPPSLGNARSNKTYILVLTDPDAKSRKNPIWSEMCHWVVTNVTSPELGGPGDPGEPPVPAVLKSYLPPNPPAGTNWHRYVFVLMAADQTQAEKLQAPKRRKHWGYGEVRHGVRDWANEYRLQVLGANFFYAKSE